MSTPTRDRWWYLTVPYEELLDDLGTFVFEKHHPDLPNRLAQIIPTGDGRIAYVEVSPDVTGFEREMVLRALLAKWHGADVTDWPVPMVWSGGRA